MKKILATTCLLFIVYNSIAQDISISYYLPEGTTYNPAVPTPKDIIYHEVGEWHVTHDRLVNYMKAVAAAAPERVKLETMGFTYESRPQVLLVITSARNQQKLETLRQQHLLLSDPARSAGLAIDDMPIVVWIGHSIHGNESSGSNAALLTAYYLAAGQGKAVEDILDHCIILLDPSFNPDGLQRFSTWANQHKSRNLVTDPNSREFNEVWPGGRFNHYWFDLNRDWLPVVHKETENRLKWFHYWKPNILTDHHEQGSNATFFFQPGVPSRVNPLTPLENQELTGRLAKYHAQFLDRIGSLYFTKENYDDFYYGKGSTYPDINGAIGILFEQASSRGHAQQTVNGILRFPATIKNQFVTALSTLTGAVALRKDFLEYQRRFYKDAMAEAAADAVKGYVFGDEKDRGKTAAFLDMLLKQQVAVYELNSDLTQQDKQFKKGSAYMVPMRQPQVKVIKAIFENVPVYKDSLFYDITAWNMPLAFGMPVIPVTNTEHGKQVVEHTAYPGTVIGGKSDYAYLLEWNELMSPAALNELQQAGFITKVATNKFTLPVQGGEKRFGYGTIVLSVKMQATGSEGVFNKVTAIAKKYGIDFYSAQTGNAVTGSDLGSSKFVALNKPEIAMITGAGVNATDAGEIWFLLDQRMNITATHLDQAVFNRADIGRYNTIIMAGGNYNELNKEKLKTWVQNGGSLVLLEEAVVWASQNGINTVNLKKARQTGDSVARIDYMEKEQLDGAQQIAGAIFGADADLSHPLAYGYRESKVSFMKANKVFLEKSKNPYATPYFYKDNPLQSGWVSKENALMIRNSAAVVVNTIGAGRIINIADNPNFRAFWLGGAKLMLNAIFFSRVIDLSSGRTE